MQTSGVLSILYLVYFHVISRRKRGAIVPAWKHNWKEFCCHDLRPLDISDCLIGTDPEAASNGVGIINNSTSDILLTNNHLDRDQHEQHVPFANANSKPVWRVQPPISRCVSSSTWLGSTR